MIVEEQKTNMMSLAIFFTSCVFNIFRTLIYPSTGACDYSVELPHWSYCSWFDVCWSFGVVGLEWYPCCRLLVSLAMLFHFLCPKHVEHIRSEMR